MSSTISPKHKFTAGEDIISTGIPRIPSVPKAIAAIEAAQIIIASATINDAESANAITPKRAINVIMPVVMLEATEEASSPCK